MAKMEEIHEQLSLLTGNFADTKPAVSVEDPFSTEEGLGFSQFNELLLLFCNTRIKKEEFFRFLVDGRMEIDPSLKIKSFEHLQDAVKNFLRFALLYYGNIKLAYEELSSDPDKLYTFIKKNEKVDFSEYALRFKPIAELIDIPKDKTFFLGHLIGKEIKEKLDENSEDKFYLALDSERNEWLIKGRHNFNIYLTSDYMDAYVATSMREKHEYYMVNQVAKKIFESAELADYKLRYFDPTQAYCKNRIDKGLSEALMLKRAKFTLYLVQENDTLGKDSELASTLAQGKPVIAFVPSGTQYDLDDLDKSFKILYPHLGEHERYLLLLKIFDIEAAWTNKIVKNWLIEPTKIDLKELKKLVLERMEYHYNKRASLLKNDHPLGIQVNLQTGVANGLLVVRNIPDCIKIILCILNRSFNFDVISKEEDGKKYILLKETISDSIFRIITGDYLLENSFWNFYTKS